MEDIEFSWVGGKYRYRKGEAITCYYQGTKQLQYRYPIDEAGCDHGRAQHWYPDGRLEREEFYEHGILQGLVREWYPTGQLRLVEPYVDSLEHGVETRWDENGKVIYKKIFVRDMHIRGELDAILNAGLLNAGHILTLSRRPELRWILLQELGYRKFLEQVKQSYPRLIKIEDEDSGARLVRIKFRKSSVSGQASALFLTFKPGPQNEEYEPYPLAPDIGLATVKDALCWAFHLPRERNRALQPIVET